MHFSIVKIYFHIHYAITGQNAFFRGLFYALLDGGHEHAVHVLTSQRLSEFEAGIAGLWFDAHPDFSELAGAAGLFFVTVLRIAFGLDRLAIADARFGK